MSFTTSAALIAAGLCLGMVALLEIGRRIGARAREADEDAPGTGVIDGAVFGLLGLLLAFSFSGAMSRFDHRRDLIVEEANAIGTAYLRLDLVGADAQPVLRDLFRRYVKSRLDTYRAIDEIDESEDAARAEFAASVTLQNEIWKRAIAATAAAPPPAGMLLLPALNEMIDLTTTRRMALFTHPPSVAFGMLIVLALASSLLAGLGMAGTTGPRWLHTLGFAIAVSAAVYVILDVEYPRQGMIRVTEFDQLLVEVGEAMP